MTSDFPRLLVATEAWPNAPGGGTAIIRQMLKDWPADNLFWWSCFPDRDQTFGQKVAAHRVAKIPPRLYPNRRWRAQRSWLLERFWVPWAVRHFQKTLADVKPDVVWVIPHCWAIPPLAPVLPEGKTGFHVSIHDYMDIRAAMEKFGERRSRQMAAMADRLYASATTRDAICLAMVEDLRARTGADGSINRAGLEPEEFDYLAADAIHKDGPIRIAYAGTIAAEDTFALFARALAQIRQKLPRPVTLDFYGDHSYRSRDWFDTDWMREHGNLPARELSNALRGCDWGLSPMKLQDNDPRYNRFSLPTKFASYLAAGLPVVAIGHAESTVMKLASQYAVGICATDGDVARLAARLLESLSESEPKKKYRAEILRCARAEFDAHRMRAALYENFRKCAATHF
jgi:glycosyltransferase involved in cell wall biosynthesis